MTLLEIEILCHYHCSDHDYSGGDFTAPAVREAINRFRDVEGLLRYSREIDPCGSGRWRRTYALTDRGTAFVEYLQRVPLPEAAWSMPGEWPQPGMRARGECDVQ